MDDKILKMKANWWKNFIFFYKSFIRGWTTFEKIFTLVAFVVSTLFLIIGLIPSLNGGSLSNKTIVLTIVAYIANVTNFMSIILSAKKKISNFWWGYVGMITLGIVSFLNNAPGSYLLYWAADIPLSTVGLVLWRKSSKDKKHVEPKAIQWWLGLIVIVVSLVIVGVFAWSESTNAFQQFMYGYSIATGNAFQDWFRYLCDAGVLVVGLVAMILMTMRYRIQWFLWLTLDIICVALWIDICFIDRGNLIANIQTVLTWVISLINAIYGTWQWRTRKE